MVVDEQGDSSRQRELPRMALVRPTLRTWSMVLRAPGMLALHMRLDAVEAACRVRVWDDEVAAFDMGDLAAQWFSDFLAGALRLVRFDPAAAAPVEPTLDRRRSRPRTRSPTAFRCWSPRPRRSTS